MGTDRQYGGEDAYGSFTVDSPRGGGCVVLRTPGGRAVVLTALCAENLAERLARHAQYARGLNGGPRGNDNLADTLAASRG